MNHIALVYKGDGASIAACSRCTSDAVHIILGVAGRVEVQDEGNVVDVDAARHDVGSYKDVGMSSLEGEHDFVALFLVEVAMHGAAVVAEALQGNVKFLDHELRRAEDDDALRFRL